MSTTAGSGGWLPCSFWATVLVPAAKSRDSSITRCSSPLSIRVLAEPSVSRFAIIHSRTIGPESVYNIDTLLIDGNTGTQLDVPPHSVARPDLKREKSGLLGLAYTDKIEPWQFGGEACVVDVRDLLDQAPNGTSPLVKPEHVERFEKQHRPVRLGDVVLFRSGYSDKYYQPLPEGRRFIADILDRKAPGYPDPDRIAWSFWGNAVFSRWEPTVPAWGRCRSG